MIIEHGIIYTPIGDYDFRDEKHLPNTVKSTALKNQWRNYVENGHDSLFTLTTLDGEEITFPVSVIEAISSVKDKKE
ncbi:MAG: hypothetical protein Q4A55_06770 [Aerococcus sp.]|nr:hypothetical protein [Aerococcus sp.]